MIRALLSRAPPEWKQSGRLGLQKLLSASLRAAVREQGLGGLMESLSGSVPDIRQQYSSYALEGDYTLYKVRAQHAFQISVVQEAIERLKLGGEAPVTIVDIGDSAGTHIQYLRGLHGRIRSLSVNLDADAVARIRAKGLEAIHARAEDLNQYDIHPDIFISFQTLEHLHAPLTFLRSLAGVNCRGFVVTVPYVSTSRVSLSYIRQRRAQPVVPENVHVFELSPDDLRVLFQFAGWRVVYDRVYLQYPTAHPLRATKPLWKQFDFEGFYGAVLEPDDTWSRLYHE